MTDRIQLGNIVRDTISGYEGVCMAKVEYLTGCNQVGIKPKGMKPDGGTFDTLYFDEPFVEVVNAAVLTPIVPRVADAGAPGFTIKQG